VSDRLKQSLMSSRSEIEAGLTEAESELAQVRQRGRELEELIALGTATLLAAEMISGSSSRQRATPSRSPMSRSEPTSSGTAAETAETDTSKAGLRSRLSNAQE
jgi:hypothetical protein